MSESNEKILSQDPETELTPLEESEIPEEILEVLEQMPEEAPQTAELPEEDVDTKAAREAARAKAEKRTSRLYMIIGILFVVVAIVAVVWRTGLVQKNATAVTIGDEKYSAGEVNFYFENVYRNFITQASSYINYIGLDVNSSLRDQVVSETAAELVGGTPGMTWHDTFMEQAITQMSVVKAVTEKAEAEGYVYPSGMMAQYEESVQALKDSAAAAGVSVDNYLANMLDPTVTEDIYNEHLLRMMKYSAYAERYSNSLTYTDEELEETYQSNSIAYDLVSYEYVLIDGGADGTEHNGTTLPATQEQKDAALETAKKAAEEMLAAAKSGADLETLAAANEKATYSYSDEATYYGDNVTAWLFDDARKSGDMAHLDNGGTNQYVVLFKDRYRDETPTIDVRHILFMPETTLTTGEEGYEEEFEQLLAECRTQAADVYAQWQAGEATEESFGELALEYSTDGSRYSGGLYAQVPPGYMVESFNDWCFDPARQSGDTDVIETEYGVHIMYFVRHNLMNWQLDAAAVLQAADATEWVQEMAASFESKQHSFGMKFVD